MVCGVSRGLRIGTDTQSLGAGAYHASAIADHVPRQHRGLAGECLGFKDALLVYDPWECRGQHTRDICDAENAAYVALSAQFEKQLNSEL